MHGRRWQGTSHHGYQVSPLCIPVGATTIRTLLESRCNVWTENHKSLQKDSWAVIALAGAVGLACMCLVWGNAGQAVGQTVGVAGPVLPQPQNTVARQILGAATQAFRPSLEMKENVDFLLTPALLVQEAMSKETVVTYPSE